MKITDAMHDFILYLGHASIRETSRYLTMTKELFDEASHRFELYASPGGKQ